MSLFRQQALEQRRLPEPLFTPVTVVWLRRWVWVGLFITLLTMAGVWLLFGTLYTTYDVPITTTGAQTQLTLPSEMASLVFPVQAIAYCPQPIRGLISLQPDSSYILQLEQPVQAACQLTLIQKAERPLERLLP